jgi:hypothetical protein
VAQQLLCKAGWQVSSINQFSIHWSPLQASFDVKWAHSSNLSLGLAQESQLAPPWPPISVRISDSVSLPLSLSSIHTLGPVARYTGTITKRGAIRKNMFD